jgi:hypothetical protein
MSKISLNKQLTLHSTLHSHLEQLNQGNSCLKFFCYLTQTQRAKIEYLFHFLQKYKLKLEFLTKEKRFHMSHAFQVNANFIVQSTQPISQSDFIAICSFLSLHIIIVSFYYQNQIWTVSRFLKWHKVLLLINFKNSKDLDTSFSIVNLNSNSLLHLWFFFNQRIF